MPATHLEIETTFDVPEDFVGPVLTGVPQVATVEKLPPARLVAVYHDTQGLRLLRAGITLRRREGGEDAGWHLKLPRPDGRLEVHAPLGGAGAPVPAELVSLARPAARREEVAPVARLTTRRRVERLVAGDGRVLADVAYDEVVAETGAELGLPESAASGGAGRRWREVEVELVDGDEEVLADVADVLVAAGARAAAVQSKLARALGDRLLPSQRSVGDTAGTGRRPPGSGAGTAGDVALAYCFAQVEELRTVDSQVRLDVQDAVHRMRVACRRLRSALATFRPVLDRRVTDPIRDELRWLGRALGDVRDLEVLGERVRRTLDDLDKDLVRGRVTQRLGAELQTRRAAAVAAARHELDSGRYLDLLDRLDVFTAAPPLTDRAARPAQRILAPRLLADVDRVLARAEVACSTAEPDRDAAWHEVRKAAKRARYAAEAMEAAVGKPARRVVSRLKDVQELLGSRQDAAVTRGVVQEVAAAAARDGEDTFTYGLLVGLELGALVGRGADEEIVGRLRLVRAVLD